VIAHFKAEEMAGGFAAAAADSAAAAKTSQTSSFSGRGGTLTLAQETQKLVASGMDPMTGIILCSAFGSANPCISSTLQSS
jgi:hypothetical protein